MKQLTGIAGWFKLFGLVSVAYMLVGCSSPARTTVTPATASSSYTRLVITPPAQPVEPQRPVIRIYVPGAESVNASSSVE